MPHISFLTYLTAKFEGDAEKASTYAETAEGLLPGVLNSYFGLGLGSIHDLRDPDEVERLRKRIKSTPILKGIDKSAEPSYTDALKWYKNYLRSLGTEESPGETSDAGPQETPGEKHSEEPDEAQQKTPDEASEETPTTSAPSAEEAATPLRTIFLEGEAAESQPAEYRRRSRQLREACVEHFRRLHGGRIVCECCGFDFSRAYDIETPYIEVHHRFPLSHTQGEHTVDPVRDLVPLCANCHRIIHHGQGGNGSCMSLKELRERYRGVRWEEDEIGNK